MAAPETTTQEFQFFLLPRRRDSSSFNSAPTSAKNTTHSY